MSSPDLLLFYRGAATPNSTTTFRYSSKAGFFRYSTFSSFGGHIGDTRSVCRPYFRAVLARHALGTRSVLAGSSVFSTFFSVGLSLCQVGITSKTATSNLPLKHSPEMLPFTSMFLVVSMSQAVIFDLPHWNRCENCALKSAPAETRVSRRLLAGAAKNDVESATPSALSPTSSWCTSPSAIILSSIAEHDRQALALCLAGAPGSI